MIMKPLNPTSRYTLTQTAEYLGVSYRTVQRYVADGRIKAKYKKINNRPFISGMEIIKALNEVL